MILESKNKNFTLRPWNPEDVHSLVKNANNIEIAKFLTDMFPHPYTEADALNFIGKVSENHPANVFAIEVGGLAVGGIGIHPQHDIMKKNAELGYWLGESYWGKGIISEAISMIVDYAFQHFDISRIYARPFGSNLASQKVLEKNGFVLEGKFDKTIYKFGLYEDELIYAIRRDFFKSSENKV